MPIAAGSLAVSMAQVDDSMKEAMTNQPLQNAPHMLSNVLGPAAEKIFAMALLASGQSSTMTGTYAGRGFAQLFLELCLFMLKSARCC